MAEASKVVEMLLSRERIWKAITDYENYPQFVDNVHRVKILSREGGHTCVEYVIELMGKEIRYVLDHDESRIPDEMTWTFVESALLKGNKGYWKLQPKGEGRTEVSYSIDLEFNFPVPGFIMGGLIRSTLPKMLGNFETRAKKVG